MPSFKKDSKIGSSAFGTIYNGRAYGIPDKQCCLWCRSPGLVLENLIIHNLSLVIANAMAYSWSAIPFRSTDPQKFAKLGVSKLGVKS